MTSSVLIRLLGGFRLSVAGREVTSLPRKAQALLAYLAMQDGRPVSRETVSDLLWTDRGARQAKASLRQNLLVTRQALRDAGAEVIDTPLRMVAFVPGIVETDVGRFRLLARASDRASLAEAAEVYAGTLLDRFPPVSGDFDDWLVTARAEVTDAAIDVLHRLTDACLAEGDVHPAVLAAERMLALDLLREDSHRLLMEVYLRAGRRADAIRQYEACVEVLRRELDVAPSEETEGVVRGIRRNVPSADSDQQQLKQSLPMAMGRLASDTVPWIAVLPFRTYGPDPVPQYFSAGLVEDIVSSLAAFREPVVVSANSTAVYKDQPVRLGQIAADLNVSYVVSGSIRRLDTQLRIVAELAQAVSGAVIWSRAFDTSDTTLFDIQVNIAAQIAHTLVPQVFQSDLRAARRKSPDSTTAYDLVLQARDIMIRMRRDEFAEAGKLLSRAISLDPHYSGAHASLAAWQSLRLGQGWSAATRDDALALEEAAQQAIFLDTSNAQAMALLAHNKTILSRRYDEATSLIAQAIDAAPNDASVWMWSSPTAAFMGDGQEAVARAERALRLSPYDPLSFRVYHFLNIAHYANGDYEQAVEWGLRCVRENPDYTSNLRSTAACLIETGRVDESRDLARRAMQIEPNYRVQAAMSRHPFQSRDQKERYGRALLAAGLPV